jgi:PEP-CTERM motif-containing protein
MTRLLVLGALVFAASIGTARATTITFEDQGFVPTPPFNAEPRLGDLTSGGFFFDTASNGYQLANNSASVDNGTTYLVTQGEPLSQVTFSPVGGAPFALTSFDYAEWQEANTAHQIIVMGNLVGGGTISMPLTLDLVFDGPGAQPDFQTVNFDSNWANLLSVVLTGIGATSGTLNYFAIDDINVDAAAVPEPGALTLLSLGSAAYLIRRRRRHGR